MIIQPMTRKRLFKAKLTQAVLVTAVFVLGIGSVAPFASFNQSASALESWETGGWERVSAGYDHTCAISLDGNIYCWGANWAGQLGNNSTEDSLIPVAVDISGALAGK